MKNIKSSALSLLVLLFATACGRIYAQGSGTQWQRLELPFTAAGVYTNPVVQVDLTTTFFGPTGLVYNISGFWDGGNTWRVRFTPPASGVWTFSNNCNVADSGLAPQSGSISVAPATGTNALYLHGGFLKVAPNGHYLTYADGTPFFWLGDTCWFCPGNYAPINGGTSTQYDTPSMFEQWVNQRQTQNFDVLQLAFLGNLGTNDSSPGGQMSAGTIDPNYWQQVDQYIDYANDSGMIPAVILDTWNGALTNYTPSQLT